MRRPLIIELSAVSRDVASRPFIHHQLEYVINQSKQSPKFIQSPIASGSALKANMRFDFPQYHNYESNKHSSPFALAKH